MALRPGGPNVLPVGGGYSMISGLRFSTNSVRFDLYLQLVASANTASSISCATTALHRFLVVPVLGNLAASSLRSLSFSGSGG